MIFRLSLFCTLHFLIANFLSAQNDSLSSYSTVSPRIVSMDEKDIKRPSELNGLKFNLSQIVKGSFQVSYERYVFKKFSIEPAIGITYRDFFFEFENKNFDMNGIIYIPPKSLKILPGFTYELALKYYIFRNSLCGIYSSLLYRYKLYNLLSVNPNFSDINLDGKYKLGYNQRENGFVLGYQYEHESGYLYFDDYIGLGYREVEYRYFDDNYDVAEVSFSRFFMFIGIKVGYLF